MTKLPDPAYRYRSGTARRGFHAVGITAVVRFVIIIAVLKEPLRRVVVVVVYKPGKVGNAVKIAVVKLFFRVLNVCSSANKLLRSAA